MRFYLRPKMLDFAFANFVRFDVTCVGLQLCLRQLCYLQQRPPRWRQIHGSCLLQRLQQLRRLLTADAASSAARNYVRTVSDSVLRGSAYRLSRYLLPFCAASILRNALRLATVT